MKRVSCAWYLCAVAGLLSATGASAEVVDEIVATVDTEVILRSDLEDELAPVAADMRANATSEEEFQGQLNTAFQEVLDQAIEQRLLYREAVLAGAKLEDDVLEERIQRIQSQYPSADEFLKTLEKAGETMSDFRERVRKQMIAISFSVQKRRMWEGQAVISDAEARAYYDSHREEFGSGAQVQVRRLFLAAGSDKTVRDQVKAKAEDLRLQIENGADFAELAKANSQGPEAEDGGLMGWVGPGDLVSVLEEAVLNLSTGQITPVIETDFGFQFLRVEARQDAGEQTFEKARTIIEPKLRQQYALEKYKSWVSELRKRSRVRVFM